MALKVTTNVVVFIILLTLLFINPLFGVFAICIFSPLFSQWERNVSAIMVVVICVLFYSTVQPFGDIAEYLSIYKNIGNIDIFNFPRFGKGIEIFILAIMKVTYIVTNGDEFLFLLLIYFIVFLLLVVVCKKISDTFFLLLFFSVFFSYGFLQANSYFLRQMISVLFVFMMILTSPRINKFIYGVGSIISHTSAILAVCAYMAVLLRKNKKFIYLIATGSACAFIIFYNYGLFSFVVEKISSANKKFSVLNNFQIIVYNIPFMLIFMMLYKFRYNINDTYRSKIIIIFALMNVSLFWLLITVPAMSNRLALFMCAFPCLLLYPILRGDFTFEFKYKILLLIVSYNIMPMMYTLYFVELKGSDLNFLNYKPITSTLPDIICLFLDRFSGDLPYLNQGN